MKANNRNIIYWCISTVLCVVLAEIVAKYFFGEFAWWKIAVLGGFILTVYILEMALFKFVEKKIPTKHNTKK